MRTVRVYSFPVIFILDILHSDPFFTLAALLWARWRRADLWSSHFPVSCVSWLAERDWRRLRRWGKGCLFPSLSVLGGVLSSSCFSSVAPARLCLSCSLSSGSTASLLRPASLAVEAALCCGLSTIPFGFSPRFYYLGSKGSTSFPSNLNA